MKASLQESKECQRGSARLLSPELQRQSSRFYEVSRNQKSITCHVCGFTSTDPRHVQQKYCPQCQTFHEDRILMLRLAEGYRKEFLPQTEEWERFREAA